MAVTTIEQSDRIRTVVSVTRNLGNYESLKIEASFETSARGSETPEEAFDRAWLVVDTEVNEKVLEALGGTE